jgi:AraC-like DNA-binding protein
MFHFDKNFGLFIGKLIENNPHKHYALQLSISVKADMFLLVEGDSETSGKAFFLNSKVEHRLISKSNQLTILINPLSSIGHQLYLKFENTEFLLLKDKLSIELTEVLNQFECNEFTFEHLCDLVSQILIQYQCNCESENHLKDDRIIKAIKYLDDHFEKVLSLEVVSDHVHLSPTRFLHLFKEKTNLSFRRYQLWNKLVKSLPYLTNHSILDTAHAFGFSDSSHYTRTFKETFGVTPKFVLPKQ